MYVVNDSVSESFEIVSSVVKYALLLSEHLSVNVAKYKTLLPFCIHAGACFGSFYEFEFKRKDADEMTTIGYAANYAAKLQHMAGKLAIVISENIYDELEQCQKNIFTRKSPRAIKKYKQDFCYEAYIRKLAVRHEFDKDFERAVAIAKKVDLQDMEFRSANQPLN